MSHANKIDPAIEIMLKRNLETAFVDASSTNVKVDVLPAHDGEIITEYIKNITDKEAVEQLDGTEMSEEDRQLRLQVNKNAEDLSKQSLELNKITVTMAGGNGVKGYVQRTEEAIVGLNGNLHDGLSSLSGLINNLDKTIVHSFKEQSVMMKEQTEKIKKVEHVAEDHERRIFALEERNKEEDRIKEENRKLIKFTLFKNIFGAGGWIAMAFMAVKTFVEI